MGGLNRWLTGLSLALCMGIAAAQPATPMVFKIEAKSLEEGLNEFAKQTGLQVIFRSEAAAGMQAPLVNGTFVPEEALRRLLAESGLAYQFINARTIAVRGERITGAVSAGGQEGVMQLAQADNRSSSAEPGEGKQVADEDIKEIIVTAQKREERLQDVPVPVTAIDADSLFSSNQLRLQDYYTKVPGLNLVTGTRGDAQLLIRGIATGTGTNPTVGVTVDDVPYGSAVASSSGFATPDLDPSDLARIEILRGPQGTFYGAASLGGLLKFATVDPSTDRLRGRVEGGVSDIRNGDKVGHNVRGAVNVPLTDTLAVRLSGFTRRNPGYIDNIVTGAEGANRNEVDGGRLSALWRPSQNVSVKLSGLIQDFKRLGSPLANVGPGFGDLQQNAPRNTGDFNRKFQAYSAILQADLGSVELASVSGYNITKIVDSLNLPGLGGIYENLSTDKFTQEVRLSTLLGSRFEWLVGGFYAHENSETIQDFESLNPATGAKTGTLLYVDNPSGYSELAAFTDVTYHITDRFDLQVGGRESHNQQEYSRVATGPLTPAIYRTPSPAVLTEQRSSDNSFTYLVTPRFKVSADLMLYARFASGYRPGSNNGGLPNVPVTSKADTTSNYEIGAKGDFLNRLFSYEVSLYHIDWKDIQLLVLPPGGPGTSYYDNVGRAKSEGVELSFLARPLTGMTITAWGAYNKAELRENFPSTTTVGGGAGERLPFSAPRSGNLSINQEFRLTSTVAGYVEASMSYLDERQGPFVGRGLRRQVFPGYTQLNVSSGLALESWRVNLYANNIADKRGAVTGDPTVVPSAIIYTQPRTIGVNISHQW